MVVFPNCKINLGLHVVRKRADGYHDLETVFYPLPLYDALEWIPGSPGTSPLLSQSGIKIDGPSEKNLCIKAWQLLKNDFESLPGGQVHLHKVIPTGAGLGGGSADAAFMLRLLNTRHTLGIPENRLADYALRLGSDCPFFLNNEPCFATFRGEVLEPLAFSLRNISIVLVHPGIHVSTADAFASIKPSATTKDLREVIKMPVTEWKEHLVNDFEQGVFERHPEIKAVKDALYTSGALYASMSGSGSSVFGLFPGDVRPGLLLPRHYFVQHFPAVS